MFRLVPFAVALATTLLPRMCCEGQLFATELIRITEENYNEVVPTGKEVDAIYGDWILRNKHVTAVIANTSPGRKANMTVRGVGGMLIDYTTRYRGSDQLSCFYPSGGRYLFNKPASLQVTINDSESSLSEVESLQSQTISLVARGVALSGDDTVAVVRYTLTDGQPFLNYSVELQNLANTPKDLRISDTLRCDGDLFETWTEDGNFFAEDKYFGQCYLFSIDGKQLERAGGRNMELRTKENASISVSAGESLLWKGKILCSQSRIGSRSLLNEMDGGEHAEDVILLLKTSGPRGPVQHASVEYFQGEESLGIALTDRDGFVRTHLPAGEYVARIRAEGHEQLEHPFEVIKNKPRADNLTLEPASRVRAKIVDENNLPIPAKVQFLGMGDTQDPDFGPTSAIDAIKNAVYTPNGEFEQSIDPGTYQVIVSHGPEYDAEIRVINVTPGKLVQLSCQLPRVVDTTGWISSEFHSHSSPSGDNVSHQTGRVLNLLAEQIEFAPCTEHNRVDTYADDLELLEATRWMATCTGMELTGGPLPINHQNAFPLVMHEHIQDGGGPTTDSNPVKQIERLALWDNSSSKVVQSNHPDIPAILGDRDVNGIPDDGFRGMLGWMDIIEIHPPELIFETPKPDLPPNKRNNRMFYWLQLLNLGYRIPGVVNTDAHYNFHGSGWLRNYMECSTDLPSEISIDEMIHVAEHGHMVMTTGPFLQAQVRKAVGNQLVKYAVGEDVDFAKGDLLWIRVQCPNWFDVNRVQVFANGRPLPELNFTRRENPSLFHDEQVVRFETQLLLPDFKQDTHLIVATIGEGLKLGPVMGAKEGERPPVAVTNPFFLDVDGGGFQGNGDDLGIPFLLNMPEE